jgi:poly-gamma-glutamate system protein
VSPNLRNRFLAAGLVSLAAWVALELLAPGPLLEWTPAMREAAEAASRAQEATAAHCAEAGIGTDALLDPAGTCLLGPELTELFTSLGRLEAKRTSLTPDAAALLVHLLREAGVGTGDRVAIGASGSFPALLIAGLAAVEAVGAHPVPILSLGASSYGATRPDFHLLDLYRVIREAGVVAAPPAAVSLGGEGDVGGQFDPAFREALVAELEAGQGSEGAGPTFILEPELAANVAARMAIYGEVSAFINVEGAEANLGTDARVLSVPPGLSLDLASDIQPPPPAARGVLFEMASRGVPVVHLLNLRGLALRYGLPWDPPLPPPPGG